MATAPAMATAPTPPPTVANASSSSAFLALIGVSSFAGILLVLAPQLARQLRWLRGRQKLAPLPARRASVQTSMQYPMYVMAVDELLEQKNLRPHQQLLAENKIVKAVPGMTIVCVSLEWLSLHHPECVWMKALELRSCQLCLSACASRRRVAAQTASISARFRARSAG